MRHILSAIALSSVISLIPALPVSALDLQIPGRMTVSEQSNLSVHRIASGPSQFGSVPQTEHEGPVFTRVWEIQNATGTRELFNDIRSNLEGEGFDTTFQCAARACGGFDFRFAIDLYPAPDMFVDLSDFQYLAAHRDDAVASLMVSRSGGLFYAQLTLVGGPGRTATEAPVTLSTRSDPMQNIISTELETAGVTVLNDVTFKAGSAQIADQFAPSLEKLARYLALNPKRSIALVGHTDAKGDRTGNMSLSIARATAVRNALVDTHGVDPKQIDAQGIGFFAPRASNLTNDGRAKNRRVEAVLTSTQ